MGTATATASRTTATSRKDARYARSGMPRPRCLRRPSATILTIGSTLRERHHGRARHRDAVHLDRSQSAIRPAARSSTDSGQSRIVTPRFPSWRSYQRAAGRRVPRARRRARRHHQLGADLRRRAGVRYTDNFAVEALLAASSPTIRTAARRSMPAPTTACCMRSMPTTGTERFAFVPGGGVRQPVPA